MAQFIIRFIQDERGMTAIEYALIAALISLAIVTAVVSMGGKLTAAYQMIADAI